MEKIAILKNYILKMKDFAASQKTGNNPADVFNDGYVLACSMILEQIDTL